MKKQQNAIIGAKPICFNCKHFNFDALGATCSAFPEGIDDKIYIEGNKHASPIEGQTNNIIFEKASPKELERRAKI